MVTAADSDEYAHEWREFLFHLERVWERALNAYESRSSFQKLNQKYRKLRKGDPLLRYLKQARNAETHTLQGTLTSPLNIMVRDKSGRPFNLSRLDTTLVDGCLTIDIRTHDILLDLDADVSRGTPSLARFLCRGKWYNPPSSHLGNRLSTQNPVVVGKIGLDCCRHFVQEIAKTEENRDS